MESFVWLLLFVKGTNCNGFYNYLENPFLEEINGMDMNFSFGDRFEKNRVEVDNVGTTAKPKHVDDNFKIVENDKNVVAPAWFDIGQYEVRKVDKVEEDKPVKKINKIQAEKYKMKDNKNGNKFHLKVRKHSPEYSSTKSPKPYTIFAIPTPVTPRRRKDTKIKQPSHPKYSQRKSYINYQVDRYSLTPTPTSKKPKVHALKRWDIPFTSLVSEQNSVQASDWNTWGRHDYSDQSWAKHDYSDQASTTNKNIVVNVTHSSEIVQKKEDKDVFKPFTNKKSRLTKHNEQYRQSPATSNSHPFKNSNNWSPNGLQKSPQINPNQLKVNPSLSKLCLKTQAADVIALCKANHLKIMVKRRPVPEPSNRRYHQPSNKHREQNTTKIITTEDEVLKENTIDKKHIQRFRKSKSEPEHLFFEQNGFGRRKAKSSFLETIASSVATLMSPRTKNIFQGSRRLQGKSGLERDSRRENWMQILLRNNKFKQ